MKCFAIVVVICLVLISSTPDVLKVENNVKIFLGVRYDVLALLGTMKSKFPFVNGIVESRETFPRRCLAILAGLIGGFKWARGPSSSGGGGE